MPQFCIWNCWLWPTAKNPKKVRTASFNENMVGTMCVVMAKSKIDECTLTASYAFANAGTLQRRTVISWR